jgi:hypothetical protein
MSGYARTPLHARVKELYWLATNPRELAHGLWPIDGDRRYSWHPLVRKVYDEEDAKFLAWCRSFDPSEL